MHLPVTPIDSLRILEEMSDKAKPEFSLDQFSEAETDEEFGLPEFKDHFADTLTPAVLRDWTAKDFASIYVRFRPHLERHARRFLVNPSQVEEVVQDAFLYLMTSLPELDSELGVLKFLKWKVRLLCLDIIRVSSRVNQTPLDDLQELSANGPDLTESIERAEDSAVVALALAKLSPRHRQALLASVIQEKSAREVSEELGMSENAFRQLLFRAKASFRLALVGEANTAGLQMSEIVSLAVRKAASNSVAKSLSVAALIFGAVSATLTIFPLPPSETAVVSIAEGSSRLEALRGALEDPNAETQEVDADAANVDDSLATQAAQVDEQLEEKSDQTNSLVMSQEGIDEELPIELGPAEVALLKIVEAETSNLVSLAPVSATSVTNPGVLEIANEEGFRAFVAFDVQTQNVFQYVHFAIERDDIEIALVPKNSAVVIEGHGENTRAFFAATDFLAGDLGGSFEFASMDTTRDLRIGVTIMLEFDSTGEVLTSSISGKKLS